MRETAVWTEILRGDFARRCVLLPRFSRLIGGCLCLADRREGGNRGDDGREATCRAELR
jgi:hypothetical protein